MRHFVDDQFDFLQVLAIHDALRVDKKNRLTYKQVMRGLNSLREHLICLITFFNFALCYIYEFKKAHTQESSR